MFRISDVRKDFPILERKIKAKQLVYLDNASTSQKPIQIIEAVSNFYKNHNANVHRGIYTLSVEATEMLEAARIKVAKFINAPDPSEIVFVRNATEGINLAARSLGDLANWKSGDEIVLTQMEHHSNIVPWQLLKGRMSDIGIQIKIKYIPIDKEGKLDLSKLEKAITKKTRIVSFCHVSNVLGTINPAAEIIQKIHKLSVIRHIQPRPLVLIDGAQAVPHMPVNVSKIGCDFYVFTGHKMLGPTGVGVLWAKKEILEILPPFIGGGEMIKTVDFEKSTYENIPLKFEAGTPNVAGAIGLASAIDYINAIGIDKIQKHEQNLTSYSIDKLSQIPQIKIFGPGENNQRSGVVSFNLSTKGGQAIHAHDVASILDSEGVAVRSGHHCAQPLMQVLGIPAAARASFYLYNTKEEIDKLVTALNKVLNIFSKK